MVKGKTGVLSNAMGSSVDEEKGGGRARPIRRIARVHPRKFRIRAAPRVPSLAIRRPQASAGFAHFVTVVAPGRMERMVRVWEREGGKENKESRGDHY